MIRVIMQLVARSNCARLHMDRKRLKMLVLERFGARNKLMVNLHKWQRFDANFYPNEISNIYGTFPRHGGGLEAAVQR